MKDLVLSVRSLVAVAVVLLAACGTSSPPDEGATPTSEATTTTAVSTTTAPLVWTATIAGEVTVNPAFRQGIARVDGGWVITNNNMLFRTDEDFTVVQETTPGIPPELAARGYDHMGDGDVHDGLLWVPLETPDKETGVQVTARFDPETLEPVDSFEVAQHNNAFVTVADDGLVWSADRFIDDTLVRYRVDGTTVMPEEPLQMSRTIERIQGADIGDGAIWLATDDDTNGIYRVDMDTGEVQAVGSMGRVAGEGEGIDATPLPIGLLHTLVIDENIAPAYAVHLEVTSTPER